MFEKKRIMILINISIHTEMDASKHLAKWREEIVTQMYKWQLPQNRLSFWKQKWATNWAKEEPGHKVKNRDTEYSFPKLATISPVKNWITSMITFPPVDNEQPWAWQRKATHPSSLAANLSCYKHTFSTLKTSVGLLWINPRGGPNVRDKRDPSHLRVTCHLYSFTWPRA